MVDLANSYDILEKLLDASTAPSNDAAPASPAASVKIDHTNAIEVLSLLGTGSTHPMKNMIARYIRCMRPAVR